MRIADDLVEGAALDPTALVRLACPARRRRFARGHAGRRRRRGPGGDAEHAARLRTAQAMATATAKCLKCGHEFVGLRSRRVAGAWRGGGGRHPGLSPSALEGELAATLGPGRAACACCPRRLRPHGPRQGLRLWAVEQVLGAAGDPDRVVLTAHRRDGGRGPRGHGRQRDGSGAQRARALAIPRALSAAVRAFEGGERDVATLRALVVEPLERAADTLDYATLATADTVEPLPSSGTLSGPALLAVALRLGSTRLIDNVVLRQDPAPLAAEET